MFVAPIAAIELLSPGMLGWLAAAGIPLAINLWIRSRAQETPWAAIELLFEAVRNESRRIRLHNWLLLAIRTAAIALVAAAVTRPLWRGTDAGVFGREATHHVLILDCSASMAALGFGSGSRWDEAQNAAAKIVRAAARGDAFTVFGWGSTVRDPLGRPVQEPAAALAALGQLEQESTHGEVADAIAAAERAIDRGRKDFPQASAVEVHWLTDRAATTWGEIVVEPPDNLRGVAGVERSEPPEDSLGASLRFDPSHPAGAAGRL